MDWEVKQMIKSKEYHGENGMLDAVDRKLKEDTSDLEELNKELEDIIKRLKLDEGMADVDLVYNDIRDWFLKKKTRTSKGGAYIIKKGDNWIWD